jgi:hypothetical protein
LNPEDMMVVLDAMLPSYLKLEVANLLLHKGKETEPSLEEQVKRLLKQNLTPNRNESLLKK